ncbi:ACT domain-containing protein [Bacillota bacterium LX-D]|nr:ACT domain-containing protein [Bacillota bacterium LX-D]
MAKDKVIVTVVGKDRVGIIAGVANILAKQNVNVLDISQTTMQDFFTMILIGDMSKASSGLNEIKKQLDKYGEEIGVKITIQHEDVFSFMHRI